MLPWVVPGTFTKLQCLFSKADYTFRGKLKKLTFLPFFTMAKQEFNFASTKQVTGALSL
jgi:hypothetical protein